MRPSDVSTAMASQSPPPPPFPRQSTSPDNNALSRTRRIDLVNIGPSASRNTHDTSCRSDSIVPPPANDATATTRILRRRTPRRRCNIARRRTAGSGGCRGAIPSNRVSQCEQSGRYRIRHERAAQLFHRDRIRERRAAMTGMMLRIVLVVVVLVVVVVGVDVDVDVDATAVRVVAADATTTSTTMTSHVVVVPPVVVPAVSPPPTPPDGRVREKT